MSGWIQAAMQQNTIDIFVILKPGTSTFAYERTFEVDVLGFSFIDANK